MKDTLGISLSLGCMLHCLSLPLLLAFNISGAQLLQHEWLHLLLAIPMAGLAIFSLSHGWQQHRRLLPPLLGIAGITLLTLALSLHSSWELYLLSGAGLLLISAHLMNQQTLCRGTPTH